METREHPLAVLRDVDWWTVLVVVALSAVGVVFIHSATQYDPRFGFAGQHVRQGLFLAVSGGLAMVLVVVPYPRVMRLAWVLYGLALVGLLLLPMFGSTINGARRWYRFPGFAIQPSEFAKLATILALAAWLRFRSSGRMLENLLVPAVITAVPAGLVMTQPDLGSSLVFWPIMLAMCFAAGAAMRHILLFLGVGVLVVALAFFVVLRDYQLRRVHVWQEHFSWSESAEAQRDVKKLIRGPAYQPWQSLIAVGSGGWSGFGIGEGPQNRYDFLPYRNADYIFSVIAEETGYVGVLGLLGLQGTLVLLLLRLAYRSRERFGRVVIIGVAAFFGAQSLMHIAVCAWFVPATGLPLPLISYGGSSTMSVVLALGLAIGVGARRQHVVAADAFS